MTRLVFFGQLERWVDLVFGFIASAVLFGMMSLTFADVIRRYLFNHALKGSFELTELMMVILIFAGLPLVSNKEEHVTLDFIDHLLPPAQQKALRAAMQLLCAAVMAGLAALIWVKAGKVTQYGDTTSVLSIALGPFVYCMAILIAVTALIHLIKALTPARPGQFGGGEV